MKQAGYRDRLVELYRQSSTLDAYGSTSGNVWTKITQLWAQAVPRGSQGNTETVVAHQLYPQAKQILIIDHPDPAAAGSENVPRFGDRVDLDGRELYIEGIEEIGRRDGLRLYCKEVGDASRLGV